MTREEKRTGGSGDKSPRPPRCEWTDDKWPESMGDKGGGMDGKDVHSGIKEDKAV